MEAYWVTYPRKSSLPSTSRSSNVNDIKTKANESFINGVFFAIEAKWTPSIVSTLFSKGSEHIW